MSTQKLKNVSLDDYRTFLKKAGCNHVETETTHLQISCSIRTLALYLHNSRVIQKQNSRVMHRLNSRVLHIINTNYGNDSRIISFFFGCT